MMKLLESDTGAIERWCVKVHQAGPKAKSMLDPLIRLDYARMDHELVQKVEDALWFGIFGLERGASAKTRPTPGV
jgi:hypothetical protein